jgi:maleylacetate reductase
MSAIYVYPATERVLYGEGALALLGEECERFGAERILLLTTPSLADTELRGGVEEGLADRLVGTLDGCSQHVPLEAVNALISYAHELSPDLLVTLGGGSVIDAGKALAAGLAEGYDNASQIHEHRRRRSSRSRSTRLRSPRSRCRPRSALPNTTASSE